MSDARLFTSESVTEGHPDKICDAISDSVLDALLNDDPKSRVAVETLVTTGQVHVVGEVTTLAKEAFADITNTVRARIRERPQDGFPRFRVRVMLAEAQQGTAEDDVTVGEAGPRPARHHLTGRWRFSRNRSHD